LVGLAGGIRREAPSARFQAKSDLDILVSDFLTGAAREEDVLTQKWAFWEQLPHYLCGLGSHDLAEARTCGAACIAMYDRNPAAGAHHRVSHKFLSQQGPLRQKVLSTDLALFLFWMVLALLEPGGFSNGVRGGG
jgi:hypothetical protein